LCFFASVFEGADNVSLGLAAGKIAPELGLRPGQVGIALSASIIGLMIGAAVGGRFADRFGRKPVLVGSMLVLGVFSLCTVLARTPPQLMFIRFAVGLGLGGAFPTLISLAVESAGKGHAATALAAVYCGQPLGGAALSLVVWIGGAGMGWRPIFLIGGIGPLLIALLLRRYLRGHEDRFKSTRTAAVMKESITTVLGGGNRLPSTLLLWVACLMTLFVVYLLLNWIPTLMVAKGLTQPQAALASMMLNVGAAIGVLSLGRATDTARRRLVLTLAYFALAVALSALTYSNGVAAIVTLSTLAGFLMLGAQLVLYATAAYCYPTNIRATGVGVAVAVGRLGAVAAPLVGGWVLSTGYGAGAVLATTIPCVCIAAISAGMLMIRLQKLEPQL
jgi:AAHS family 3-hydroxyphenylpropionic acid transporter